MIDGVKHYSFATTACFGAASSADVFHDLGSAAEFIMRCATGNVVIVRYADDFLVLIPPLDSSPAHAQAMAARDRIIDVCDALGLPIAKFEGPAPSLVFVGTGIDTTLMRAFIRSSCFTHGCTKMSHASEKFNPSRDNCPLRHESFGGAGLT